MREGAGFCSAPGTAAFRKWTWSSGRFADAQIANLSDAELDEYERLLEIPDQQMFAWVSGAEAVPAEIDSALFRRLRDFHREGPART